MTKTGTVRSARLLAQTTGIGAQDPIVPSNGWPLQDEEKAIVPVTDTRD
jgi:hypothetical protein